MQQTGTENRNKIPYLFFNSMKLPTLKLSNEKTVNNVFRLKQVKDR